MLYIKKGVCMKFIRKNADLVIIVFTMFVASFIVCRYSSHVDKLEEQIEQINIEIIELENSLLEIEEKIEEIANENKEEEIHEPLFYLSDHERKIAEKIVMGECGGESYNGQVLVAQCLLNACLKDDLQPSEVRNKYKYSGWNENPSQDVKDVVSDVFDKGYKVTDEFILYFYAPKYAKGGWHETQRFITEVGGHRFFAEWDK
jgi:hypothetical protein